MAAGIQHLQKCYILGSDKATPLTVPRGYSCFEHGGFLTSSGDDTNYFWAATNDKLSIFVKKRSITASSLLCDFSFGEQAKVIDCVYFAINHSSPGVAVLVNDTSLDSKQFYVAYISLTKEKILKKILLNYSAHSLYAVSDGVQYTSQVPRLHQTFQDHWPHILAVSCFGIGAVLMHFGISSEEVDEELQFERPQHCIVLGKLFLTKNSEKYLFKGDGNKVHEGPVSNLFVTSFLYIEKSGVLVMGFPFGGIFTVSLRNQRQKSYYLVEGAVEGITMQFADDDPRGLYYLWFVFVKRDKSFSIGAQCIFQEEDERSGNFDNPTIAFGLSFILKDCIQFIKVRTIAIDRCKLTGVTRENSELSHDDSIVENKKSLSLTLYTWYGQSGPNEPIRIYGALYDLNMYYTKRIPSQMNPDNSTMKQIPYVCGFVSDDTIDLKKFELMDLMIDSTSIRAFMSVESENIDQLFYPSALHFNLMALTADFGQNFTVNSIQDQYLMLAGKNIVESWKEPTEMLVKLYSLGLCNRPFQGNDRRLYLLDTFLRHGYNDYIIGFIERTETTYDDLKFIIKWLNKEVDVAKEKLDKNAEPLFNETGISNSALLVIRNSGSLFGNITEIMEALIVRMTELKSESDIELLKVNLSVVKGLYQYSAGINFGLEMGFLPQRQNLTDANLKLRKEFREECKNAAKNNKKLEIVVLIEECMRVCKNESIWLDETATEWYPPVHYTTWLSLWLNVELAISAKVTLFGYYMCDMDKHDLWNIEKLFDKSIGTFLRLEQDKMLVLRRKIDTIYKSDIRMTKQGQLPEVFKRKKEKSEYEKLKELPIGTRPEFKIAKAKFLELPYGLHLFNLAMIEKRSFWLIEPVNDIPTPDEPEQVRRSRQEVENLMKTLPWSTFFKENKFQKMADKWADGEDQNVPYVSPKKMDFLMNKISRKRTIAEIDDTVEEDFVIITPAKKERKSIFMDTPAAKTFQLMDGNGTQSKIHSPVVNTDVKNSTIAARHMERVKKITSTPLATPRANRTRNVSPEPSTPKVQPTSILKSNKKESRLRSTVKRTRLQFEDTLEEVRSIPNRHEQKAPLPDHFTMDDSITSETDFQLAQNAEENDDDENPRMDMSIVPMRLNLDEDDEEVVEKEKDTEVDKSGPTAKKQCMEVQEEDDEEIVEKENDTQVDKSGPTGRKQCMEVQEEDDEEIVGKENDTQVDKSGRMAKKQCMEVQEEDDEEIVEKEKDTQVDKSSRMAKKQCMEVQEDDEEVVEKEKDTQIDKSGRVAKKQCMEVQEEDDVAKTSVSSELNQTTLQWLEAHKKPIRKTRIISADDELLLAVPKSPRKSKVSTIKSITKSPKRIDKVDSMVATTPEVKRGRGRPPKLHESALEEKVPKSPRRTKSTETSSETPEPKKRGRPPKVKESSSSEGMETVEEVKSPRKSIRSKQ